MSDKRLAEELTIEELEQLLYRKKRAQRLQRLQRIKEDGRLVEVAGRPSPSPKPPPLTRPAVNATGALSRYVDGENDLEPAETPPEATPRRPIPWRRIANNLLLMVEVTVVIALIILGMTVWQTARELNEELTQAQRAEIASVALPTPTATPVIGVVVLPGGHQPPVEGQPIDYSEAGNIPAHLLPVLNAYVPPPIPTPGPEQARRIQIAAIDVDAPIFQGDDTEQLKKGVGQHIGTAQPGQVGNMVLSAHNDIFGEIFRDLELLAPGDEIIVSSERHSYTYVVREILIVDPTDVWVMAPTEHASATLISCYPYRVNNKRIIVFADLVTQPGTGLSS